MCPCPTREAKKKRGTRTPGKPFPLAAKMSVNGNNGENRIGNGRISGMKIGIVGAGGVGLYYGAMLQRGGHDVRFLLRRDYDAIMASGLTVRSYSGDFHLDHVRGYRSAAEIGPVDLALVAIKTFDNDKLIDLVKPLMASNSVALTLQNGLGNEEILVQAFGERRVMGGVAMIGSTRGQPGTVDHKALGSIRIGEFSGGLSPRAVELSALFGEAGITCEAIADLRRVRWEKLIWNIPFNGLCTLLNAAPGGYLTKPEMNGLVRALMAEVITGANAQELSAPIPDICIEENIQVTLASLTGYRPSMMIDRLEGRRLELDAIYRIPLEHAARKGIHMVRVGMLHALLAAKEK